VLRQACVDTPQVPSAVKSLEFAQGSRGWVEEGQTAKSKGGWLDGGNEGHVEHVAPCARHLRVPARQLRVRPTPLLAALQEKAGHLSRQAGTPRLLQKASDERVTGERRRGTKKPNHAKR